MGTPNDDGPAGAKRYALEDRYLSDEGRVFLTGIQALARLPLEQLRLDRRRGLRTAAFISGYPGSPLGGYDGAVAAAAKLAPELPIVCRPGLNEEYGASAVMGSQLAAAQPDCRYDGIVGLWYGKAPGVDRASDAFRHAVYAGTSMRGGAVAIVGDDPAAKSSTVPSSSAGLLADMHVPLLYPGDPAEALELGRHAIALSRATGLWSALKIVADVADATATVSLRPDRFDPVLPLHEGRVYEHRPDGHLLTPRTLEVEREIVEVRYELAREYAVANQLNAVTVDPSDAWIGIVSSGITYREVREAFARLGLRSDADIEACGIRLLKMSMPIPFEPETVRRFARGLSEVFVIEEKRPGLESLVKDALYADANRPRVVGKSDENGAKLVPGYSALDADRLIPLLQRRLGERLRDRLVPERSAPLPKVAPPAVTRSPFFCSGCPHNRSTEVPDGSLVGAGIGCHTMALLMDKKRVGDIGGLGCMGNEGVQWIGMSDFVDRTHFIQNIGDGTFFHSGQLAIQASVAAGVNVTYKLLYNGAVAMTGGQDPQGQQDVPSVVRSLKEQGVSQVLITTDDLDRYRMAALPAGTEVWSRDRLDEAQRHLAEIPGTTVLIHDQRCAAESRRDRKRGRVPMPPQRVAINHRVCEGCGDCGQVSNCLSVQPIDTPFGRKTSIDQTTCNLDYSCLEGDCPSFVTITRRTPRAWDRLLGRDQKALAEQPVVTNVHPAAAYESRSGAPSDPVSRVPVDEFAMRITGIGGTGVVTVAQVVGTAAMLDGYHVRGLDQIGLSQKAGPVVSDLRLSRETPTSTNRLGEGQADLLLAFDQLVAASDKGLLTADPARTTVVGSTTGTPTGEMITHLEVELPTPEALAQKIGTKTRSDAQVWADAAAITEDLFGSATTANLFVVGMASQAGCLPISPAKIEAAIELNGVAVEMNREAFRWGRIQVADPARVDAARAASRDVPPAEPAQSRSVPRSPRKTAARFSRLDEALCREIESVAGGDSEFSDACSRYADELVAWGDRSTAEEWLSLVGRAARVERRIAPGQSILARAVADQLYRLTAYKDEYEVARLLTDDEGMAAIREVAGANDRVAWKLHPPILRALGMRGKVSLGAWAAPLIRALAAGKGLRGTRFDLFGYAEVRRVERSLVREYRLGLESMLDRLEKEFGEPAQAHLAQAIAIASLPDSVRGYEELKLARAEAYQSHFQDSLEEFLSD